MHWNENLEGRALEIASSDADRLRVMAGPGTGKTFALKRRVARLLENSTPPGKIFLVSFTRMAAHDIETEINSLAIPGVHQVNIGTLHAYCFSTLSKANVFQIIGRTPRPLLEFEERFLLEDLGVDKNCFHEDYNNRKRRLHAFEAAWAREQHLDPGWPTDESDRHFQGVLREWLLFHNAILIGELVPETLRYFRNNPACDEIREFSHILVDEYQDLNPAEQSLIDILAQNSKLTIVGDEDQSIYEAFRYAHPEGISEFPLRHPTTHDIGLDECRRCPTRIVEVAGNLIKNNIRRTRRPLLPKVGNPVGEVFIVQWNSLDEEAEGIAEYIHCKVEKREFDPGKTIVLCPRRHIGYKIRDALHRRGCSAHSFFSEEQLDGSPKDINGCAAQQAFTLFSLLVNPEDLVSLRCWLGYGSDSLLSGEYKRLRDYCAKEGILINRGLRMLLNGDITIRYTTNLVDRFRQLEDIQNKFYNVPAIDVFNEIFKESYEWAETFRQIVHSNGNELEIGEIYKLLQTTITQPELPNDVTYVRLMSLHKSKGLNADHVIIAGCVEGILPMHSASNQSFEDQRRFEEEQRRLFYVALTRAKKSLIISSFRHMPLNLAHILGVTIARKLRGNAETIASTFITELGVNSPRPIEGNVFLSSIR